MEALHSLIVEMALPEAIVRAKKHRGAFRFI